MSFNVIALIRKLFTKPATGFPSYLEAVEDHGSYFVVIFKADMSKRALEKDRGQMSSVIEKYDLYSKHILCDFSRVRAVDTATVAALVSRVADAKARNNLIVFYGVTKHLQIFMDVTRVAPYFKICTTQEEALRLIR
jgi:ABC-type transporter Mla MlaB component